jgi:predicted O-methyltransferase YrrM
MSLLLKLTTMNNYGYARLKTYVLRITFPIWEALGIHVTPVHFYQPIPDTRTLPDDLWNRNELLVDMRESEQLTLLESFTQYRNEFQTIPTKDRMICSIDAEVLYCMVMIFNPKRVVEIGSGDSSFVVRKALTDKGTGELTCIEPYPRKDLNGIDVIPKKVQEIPLSYFESLESGDILFIDSSHVLSIGSDVQYELFSILPRLKAGVLVHFHDIFIPAEYPKQWIYGLRRFWTEQYAVNAFLMYNHCWKVLWGSHFMHLKNSDKLELIFPKYKPFMPSSLWITRL